MFASLELLPQLRAAGLLSANQAVEVVPLGGGVSSEIVLIRPAGGQAFVFKRALAKLKVKDDWFADPDRNRAEQAWFDYVARFAPEAVPRLLHRGPDWFAMEYLAGEFTLWKDELMAGRSDRADAEAAGRILGVIHRESWSESVARSTFATSRNFHELRIEPYLITAGRHLPSLRAHFDAEAVRLASTELALVHGDFSPKNLMIGTNRLVVLDAEVATFGDPAFDLAFLLAHLHLKALLHAALASDILALAPAFWTSYRENLGDRADAGLEARTVRLVHLLMLARVHGKSPVEYLGLSQQDFVTRNLGAWLGRPAETISSFAGAWAKAIAAG